MAMHGCGGAGRGGRDHPMTASAVAAPAWPPAAFMKSHLIQFAPKLKGTTVIPLAKLLDVSDSCWQVAGKLHFKNLQQE
jgi:hypothetical protein